MAEEQKEQDAFLALFSAFELEQPVVSVSDLSDGEPLLSVLQVVYVTFRQVVPVFAVC